DECLALGPRARAVRRRALGRLGGRTRLAGRLFLGRSRSRHRQARLSCFRTGVLVMNALRRLSLFIALGLVCLLSAAPAHAAIERSGVWPPDERVSLTLSEVPRSEAVRRLAEEAGWSLVQQGVGKDPVSLSVKDEPADKVLLMVLSGQDGVIERDGSLVSIRGASATPDASAEPAAAKPLATPKGPEEDLFVPETGHIGKDES